jgi:heat shock protein HslJ
MKMSFWKALITASILVILAAAGCRGGERAPDLEATAWELTTLDGAPVLPDSHPTIEFNGGQVRGNASCNSFFGEVLYRSNGNISFSDLGQTLMACIKPEGLMEQEAAYMQALGNVGSYMVEGGTLKMLDVNGAVRLVFEGTEAE